MKKKDAKVYENCTIMLARRRNESLHTYVFHTHFWYIFGDRNTKTIKQKISCKWLSNGDGNVTSVT